MTEQQRLATKSITIDQLADLTAGFAADPAAVLAKNAVTRTALNDLAVNHSVVASTSRTMSTRLDDWKVTNQKKSGRCWLFAALNLLRAEARQALNLKNFEFSQNYPMYFDKLERANYYLQSIIDTADRPLDDRLVVFLNESLMGDGGQWNMSSSIFKKYGAVPQEAMPETQSSSDTAQLNARLRTLLHKAALSLRGLAADGASETDLDAAVQRSITEVHRVLTIHLGTPPSSVDWQWIDDDKKFSRDGVLTPQEFLAKYTKLNLDDYVCLVEDPRREHPKGSTLSVEYLGNVIGGDATVYLNVDIQLMKDLSREALQGGSPVWFGCDVGPQMLRQDGLWDARLFDYEGVYGVDLSLDKEERVNLGESAMTHAMLFTGVDVLDGDTRRWRVENSWGDENADQGFYTMNDSWFDEYMFEVAVDKNKLSPELQAALAEPPIILPAWDPMGALAR
ncbi:bleomycin hydrolase [Psychromicrobium silvestre]|uniref:Aminopeptidase n=1 Tax=Psychromicrobium silvestre TaxID=1645614 RepID=A0A7Y9LTX7_9MICC|nr:C1 family peptidase [Psychromicrobium silvestre]NYE95559.1 bleomycin hydrolase [Psychromicrobium silvestre]